MKVSRNLILLLSCLVLLLSFSPTRGVTAQETGPWIYFSPDPSYIYINGSNRVTVQVMIREAVDINTFDVKVNFDPSKVTLESYAYGDFLKEIICVIEIEEVDSLWLSCTQMAQPGQSGTGSLFQMVFQGVAEGTTPLTLTRAFLGNKNDEYVYPGTTDGTLNVVNAANFQYLPLIMNVSIQGVMDRGGIDVALGPGQQFGMAYSGTTTDITGNNLTLAAVVLDTYRITTNHARVLNVTAELNKTFTLASGANTVSALRLKAGNAVWTDNVINLGDYTAVCGAYGDPSLNPDADVNFDTLVDLRDLALVGGNWGLTSQMAYAAWLP